VLPEDVQAVLPGVIGHRLIMHADERGVTPAAAARHLLQQVPIP
jgi:hypothetical protein